MHEFRLGDELDDFCIKCKRLTNHQIVSLMNSQAAKVRCRTCYHDHDFRNGEPMPSKKELKKQADALAAAAAGLPVDGVAVDGALAAEAPPLEVVVPIDGTVIPPKKGRKLAAKTADEAPPL